MKKTRIGILFGGRSAEHEVSLVSALSVIKALDKNKYEIVPIGINKHGTWLLGHDVIASLKAGNEEETMPVVLPADPTQNSFVSIEQTGSPAANLDVIFPVLHGTFGEDGTVQGLLELADLPYIGAGVLGSSLSMDKILQKQICLHAGIPCVDYLWLRSVDWITPSTDAPALPHQLVNMSRKEMLDKTIERLGLPVFVKPPNLGSSVGISKAHNKEELEKAIELALQYDRKVLIEKAVENAREIEVSVLGNEKPKASVAGEIIPSNEFYDYDAKYIDGASGLKIPAELPDDLHQQIRDMAVKTVLAVEVEGMARVDFLLDAKTNKFYLNELNTIPGFTSISMYPKLWGATGLEYADLLDELVQLAINRHDQKKKLRVSYKPKNEWFIKD